MPDPNRRLDDNGYVNLDEHQARAQAIHACTLCDQDGYRHPAHRTVCDHTTRNTTQGRAKAHAVLAQINARRQQTTPNHPPQSTPTTQQPNP